MVPPSPSRVFDDRRVLREDRTDIGEIHATIEAELLRRDYDPAASFAIRLALEEGINNGFRHGNKSDPDKAVKMHCRIDDDEVLLEIEDEGPGFDPATVPDPTDDENIEIPSGRGIMLIRAYMSEVDYVPPGNLLRMVYRKKKGERTEPGRFVGKQERPD
jgi:serine/threonine-protein kinase RsbW